MSEELSWIPAWRLREMLVARELSPVELMQHVLERAERLGPELHPFLSVVPELALGEARAAEAAIARGDELGPLHGIPVSVKDVLWTRDIRTTLGSKLYEDFVPDEDCIPVERLRRAGAIVFAKANAPEFSLNRRTVNLLGPETLNPWDTRRSSGGSSGGSAVSVAAGIGPVSIGTDDGGSIRLPAAFNGVVGMFPSRGRVPEGARCYDSPISGIGPLARDVRDAALVLGVMAGPDSRDPYSHPGPPPDWLASLEDGVSELRVAFSRDLGHVRAHDEAVVDVAEEAAREFRSLAAGYDEPEIRLEDPWDLLTPEPRLSNDVVMEPFRRRPDFYGLENFLGELSRDPERWQRLTIYLRDRSDRPTALEYTMAIPPAVRNKPIQSIESVFERFDLLLTPTISRTAPVCQEAGLTPPFYTEFTFVVNLCGYCAASVPAGFAGGLPVGLQIIGRPGDEATVLRACRALERVRPWRDDRPRALRGIEQDGSDGSGDARGEGT